MFVFFLRRVTKFEKESFFSQSPGHQQEQRFSKNTVSLSHTHTHTKHLLHLIKKSIERNSELKQILIPQEYTEGSPPEKRVFLGSEASLRLQPPSRRELDWDLSVSVGL